jgi:hypothetical protein
MEMMADVVLTPRGALTRELHGDDPLVPPLSPGSLARNHKVGDAVAVFKSREDKNIVARTG